jgi:hypothetical protein
MAAFFTVKQNFNISLHRVVKIPDCARKALAAGSAALLPSPVVDEHSDFVPRFKEE